MGSVSLEVELSVGEDENYCCDCGKGQDSDQYAFDLQPPSFSVAHKFDPFVVQLNTATNNLIRQYALKSK